jgi:TRAP-type C4-dicarboxylate transport system permease large subunit
VSMHRVAMGALPFLAAQVLVLVLLVLFPQLVLWPMSWLQ